MSMSASIRSTTSRPPRRRLANPFSVNSTDFPNLGSNRTYSFSASVTPPGPPATGSGAKAEATVGANGAVTGLTITDPGSGYAAASVAITGAGTGRRQAPMSRPPAR